VREVFGVLEEDEGVFGGMRPVELRKAARAGGKENYRGNGESPAVSSHLRFGSLLS
jgi:hypothetical protein